MKETRWKRAFRRFRTAVAMELVKGAASRVGGLFVLWIWWWYQTH